MDKWTQEVPSEPGWYLWRMSPPGDVSAVEPFLVYELPNGRLRVQEYSATREDTNGWLWSEWAYQNRAEFMQYSVEYLWVGQPDTNVALVQAFRELYHTAAKALKELKYAELDEVLFSTRYDLLAALNEIHKESE